MKTKPILLAVLGIAGASVWGPQAFEHFQPVEDPMAAIPDPGFEDAGLVPVSDAALARVEEPAAVPDSPVTTPAAPAAPTPEAPSSTAQLLESLETFVGGGGGDRLAAYLAEPPAWLEERAQGGEEPAGEGQSASGPGAADAELALASAAAQRSARVEALVEAAELTAIVRGEAGAWALVDGRVLRAGDVLVPDLARVAEVRAEGVVLETPEGQRFLQLPAFQPREGRAEAIEGDEEALDEPASELAAAPDDQPLPALPTSPEVDKP